MPKLIGRGGPGRGQGRKRLSDNEETVKRTVILLKSQAEKAVRLGDGSLSDGIRQAIDLAPEQLPE